MRASTLRVVSLSLLCLAGVAQAQEVPLDAPEPSMTPPSAQQAPDAGTTTSLVPTLPLQMSSGSDIGTGRRQQLGGYGEAYLLNRGVETEVVLKRFVLFVGYQFSDWLRFYSELEVEEAKALEMEQAYLEAEPSKVLGMRAGLILVPIGLINFLHEPPTFNGVDRPMVDQVILPSTWRELGAGIYGTVSEGLHYQLYAMSGLSAAKFTADTGIRGGRGKGLKVHAEEWALTGRVNWNRVLGLDIGASFYFGGAGQNVKELQGTRVAILAADFRFARGGFEARAEYGRVFITNAARVVEYQRASSAGVDAIGSQLQGFYGEVGYDVLRLAGDLGHQLVPFVRFESTDTKAVRADVASAGASQLTNYLTAGLTYRPHPQVSVKLDYRRTIDAPSATGGRVPNADRFSLGIGVMF
jgi:hypothetical protein